MAAITAQPQTGRVGGRLWLVLIPFVVLYAAEGAIPILSVIPPVASHDFSVFLGSDAGQAFMSGNWVWFAVIVTLFVFNTALGEELLFRGLLLPRMRGAFGRWDWVANGFLFAVYHLHEPWLIPSSLVDIFAFVVPVAALPQRLDGDHRAQLPELPVSRPAPRPSPHVAGSVPAASDQSRRTRPSFLPLFTGVRGRWSQVQIHDPA